MGSSNSYSCCGRRCKRPTIGNGDLLACVSCTSAGRSTYSYRLTRLFDGTFRERRTRSLLYKYRILRGDGSAQCGPVVWRETAFTGRVEGRSEDLRERNTGSILGCWVVSIEMTLFVAIASTDGLIHSECQS